MITKPLEKLTDAVHLILKSAENLAAISRLKEDIKTAHEPFVWAVVDSNSLSSLLPENIRSAWIFVLKKDTPSGSHYHPNSIQHMMVIEGKGRAHIGGVWKEISAYRKYRSLEESWSVIEAGMPHEFFPEETDMVVVSFHTCSDKELIEISTEGNRPRHYEA